MNTFPGGELDAIGRARYKLRQAELALQYLRQVPEDIAKDPWRARPSGDSDLRLDTFFFSCLGLSQSAFYILDGKHRNKGVIRSWKMSALDESGRTRFNRMMNIRDMDVHHGKSDGHTLPAMIPIKISVSDDHWNYQRPTHYAALGIRRQATEHINPDGSTVSSFEGLRGSKCLYIDIAGTTYEASDACEWFITQLSRLLDSVEAAHGAASDPAPGPDSDGKSQPQTPAP